MKELTFIGSILPNTNRIISESDSDWTAIRQGNLVKFKNDEIFYQAVKVENKFEIRDFEVINNHTLVVKENTSIFLSPGDTLTLSYKEYGLLTVFSVLSGGKNYKVGDLIFLEGGIPSKNVEDGSSNSTILQVVEILPGGTITRVAVESRGRYIESPSKQCSVTGGSGSGAIVEIEFKLLNDRAVVERDIVKIDVGNETKITLSYPISTAVKEGKLSSKKSVLILNTNYVGDLKSGAQFDVARDFTLNYGWPLLVANSFSTHSLINQILHAQDKKIKELEIRITELEKSINAD